MEKRNDLIMALLLLVLGVLFIFLKEDVISIALTILGAGLIVIGIIDLFKKQWLEGAIKIIIGILAILFAWVITAITVYVLGAVLILWAIYAIFVAFKDGFKGKKAWEIILEFLVPVLCFAVGILIMVQGASWIFIVIGIALILDAIVTVFNAYRKGGK